MSKSSIGGKVREMLMARAAGRCQYRGCNKLITEEELTRTPGKFSAYAHVVADSPKGPRGDPVRSSSLKVAIENLMVLCLPHHKLIDVDDVAGHSEERLLAMKQEHEERIRTVGALDSSHATKLLLCGANIGERKGLLDEQQARLAVLPRYPVGDPIRVPLGQLSLRDGSSNAWNAGRAEIDSAAARLQSELARMDVKHVSILALAPIPLLMYLGLRVGDLAAGTALQRHRETEDWRWRTPAAEPLSFLIEGLEELDPRTEGPVALLLSISGRIDTNSVHKALPLARIVEIRIPEPMPDAVRTEEDVRRFRAQARQTVSQIASRAGASVELHVFPALPNSFAIEFGKLLLPKADPNLNAWDFNRAAGGWHRALQLV